MLSVAQARQKILETLTPLGTQKLPVAEALSLILVKDVVADRPIPPFNRVAMDGYAVRSADFLSPQVDLKVIGQVQAGIVTDLVVQPGEAIHIMTGAPLPAGADAVVKVENSTRQEDHVLLTEERMKAGLNVAQEGEDAAQGKVLIPALTALTTAGIAVCASVGLAEVEVYKRPKIKVISTGTEVIPAEETPLPHQIRDCNSYSVRSFAAALGAEVEFLGISEDDPEILRQTMVKGLDSDILILSGGVSMGAFDLVPQLLSDLGVQQVFHKVKLKPGKPLWFGVAEKGNCVFGLPGNPVSVQVNFKLFVESAVRHLSGEVECQPQALYLPLAEEIRKFNQMEQYFPAALQVIDGRTCVVPTSISGSGDFSNLAKSQGLVRCPVENERLVVDSVVEFLPWRAL